MSASRRHYEPMATEFGLIKREINFDSDPNSKAKRLQTLDNCISAYCSVSRGDNYRFETGLFKDWIEDTALGYRDNRGAKSNPKIQCENPDSKISGMFWICQCGNTPLKSGFFACNKDGEPMHDEGGSPTKAWRGLFYYCVQCHAVINQRTLEIVKRGRTFAFDHAK